MTPRRVGRRFLACLTALSVASGCTTSGAPSAARLVAEPTVAEQRLLEDAAQHREGRTTRLEAALIIGGEREPVEFAAMVRSLDARLAVRPVPGDDDLRLAG